MIYFITIEASPSDYKRGENFISLYPAPNGVTNAQEQFECETEEEAIKHFGLLKYDKIMGTIVFDIQKAKNDMLANFGIRIVDVSPYSGILIDMVHNKNFKGIKDYMGLLVQVDKVKQEDYKAVSDALLIQGIDLLNY